MAKFEEHCAGSLATFGKRYEEVHLWLDAFMGTTGYGYKHRKKRRHEEGIRQVIGLFGEEAGLAARQHIIRNLREEGWTEQDRFPKNEEDYVKMGLL